ncbi:hypothetical protein GA0115245_12235, partial [Streptomyces sp. di188]
MSPSPGRRAAPDGTSPRRTRPTDNRPTGRAQVRGGRT